MPTKIPTREELMASVMTPPDHIGDTIVMVKGFPVWRKPADLDGAEGMLFYDGDMRDVLEPDDPRVAK